MVFKKIKNMFSSPEIDKVDEEYLEIDLGQEKKDDKVLIKLYVLKQYEDVNEILNSLREGYRIAIIDISVLRKKDAIELKRSIAKIKKTADALEGTIAGFGENTVIVTPSFAKIQKEDLKQPASEKSTKSHFDEY